MVNRKRKQNPLALRRFIRHAGRLIMKIRIQRIGIKGINNLSAGQSLKDGNTRKVTAVRIVRAGCEVRPPVLAKGTYEIETVIISHISNTEIIIEKASGRKEGRCGHPGNSIITSQEKTRIISHKPVQRIHRLVNTLVGLIVVKPENASILTGQRSRNSVIRLIKLNLIIRPVGKDGVIIRVLFFFGGIQWASG